LKYHIVNKGSICDIFNKNFKKKINQNNSLTREIDSVCRVVVKGHSNSSWIIDFSNRDCYIDDKLKGVDFEIGLADELLVDLVSGRRNALDAFSSGEIEFRGSNSGDILINIGKILLS
jgi:putative sterol carrier protein